MRDKVVALFKKHEDEFLNSVPEDEMLHPRKDMSAFMLIHKWEPCGDDIIAGADHEIIYLGVEFDDVKLNDEFERDVITLIRLGVSFNDDADCLTMFV